MKRLIVLALLLSTLLCSEGPVFSQSYIADYSVAREEVLRSIPVDFVDKARSELVIAYQHSSHGTHVSRGVFGLQDYKNGDNQLFGVSDSPSESKLEFRDFALASYAPAGVDASDLSQDETAFIQTTRNYLDAPENASVNVVMWSWCSIYDHDVSGNYLPGMEALINEYGPGGSKIGTGTEQREIPVTFIFMTGHAIKDFNFGYETTPKEQADLIFDYCNSNQQFCLDYYTIDTYTMDDIYYDDTGDDSDSDTYGGNFYVDWQNSHTLGEQYFENKRTPDGDVAFGDHNTQHITSNRKAYAMWWILARIAGWSGEANAVVSKEASDDLHVYPNPGSGRFFIENKLNNIESISVIDGLGREVLSISSSEISSQPSIDLTGNPPGVYGLRVTDKQQIVAQSKIILVQ